MVAGVASLALVLVFGVVLLSCCLVLVLVAIWVVVVYVVRCCSGFLWLAAGVGLV